MSSVTARIGQRWDIIALVVAVAAGQVVQSVLPPQIVSLAIAAVLAVVIIVLRVRLGNEFAAAARSRAFSLPRPESLPAEYAVTDPSGRLVNGVLALLDLALLLLVQNTLRRPVLALASPNLPRGWVETAFVGVVVLIAIVLLVKLYSAARPVAALLLWWGLDQVVPTAGFLGARPQLAVEKTATSLRTSRTPTPTPARVAEATIASASERDVATVVSSKRASSEQSEHEAATVLSAESSGQVNREAATEVSAPRGTSDGTDEATVVSEPRDR